MAEMVQEQKKCFSEMSMSELLGTAASGENIWVAFCGWLVSMLCAALEFCVN